MSSLLAKIQDKDYISSQLFQFGCMMIVPAFLYSKALITLCIVSILIAGLLHVSIAKLVSFLSDFKYSLFLLIFIGIFISGFYSEHNDQWIQALNIKLPFILLPLGFYLAPRIDIAKLINIHLWLLAVLAISAIPQFLYISQHQEVLMEALGKGQPITTPVEHVKYSMMNAYGIVVAVYLLVFKYQEVAKWRNLIIFGVVIVTILMHLLAVRTGLVILYSSMGLLGLIYAYQQKSKLIWTALLITSLLTPVVAYKAIPTVHQKVNYMIHDWKMHKAGTGNNYADSQRWTMSKAGLQIWQSHPILGIGHGDLRDVSYTFYRDNLNINNLQKLPHNQFLITLMGGGIIGLLLFIIGYYGPLWRYRGELKLLLGLLYINYTLSFFVENSLERSVSVGFFLFFALLILSTRSSKEQYLHS